MTPPAPPKPPPELDAIVDRVLAYRPKDATPPAKPKRPPGGVAEDKPPLYQRRSAPPADD